MSDCATFDAYGGCSRNESIIYWILYVISTIFFIITGSINMSEVEAPEGTGKWHRLITTYLRSGYVGGDIDFTGDKRVVYICFVLYLLLTFYLLAIMALKGTVIKNALLYDMAFGKWSRFLSIPTLITGVMCLIPLAYDNISPDNRNEKTAAVFALIFNILCMAAYIFIYLRMPGCNEDKLCFLLKKGYISCAIAYHIYFFFNDVITIAYFDDRFSKHVDSRHTGSWICICLYGLIIGGLTWFWTDVVMCVVGLLFQIAFLTMSALDKSREDFGNRLKGNFICSIIFMILLFAELVAVIILKKDNILN